MGRWARARLWLALTSRRAVTKATHSHMVFMSTVWCVTNKRHGTTPFRTAWVIALKLWDRVQCYTAVFHIEFAFFMHVCTCPMYMYIHVHVAVNFYAWTKLYYTPSIKWPLIFSSDWMWRSSSRTRCNTNRKWSWVPGGSDVRVSATDRCYVVLLTMDAQCVWTADKDCFVA